MPFGRRGYYKYAVFQSSVDTRRLARRLVVQEQCLKDCAQRGIEIESAANPSLFKSTTPHGIFVRQIGGAVSEYDSRMAYEQLRNGRELARPRSKCRTLNNTRKVEGRKSFIQLFPNFVKLVDGILKRPFAKLNLRAGGTTSWRKLSKMLAKKGVTTQPRTSLTRNQAIKGGKAINAGKLMTWVKQAQKM